LVARQLRDQQAETADRERNHRRAEYYNGERDFNDFAQPH
jgi:hypothetical protein